jgi:HK97 family phage major capsid protein
MTTVTVPTDAEGLEETLRDDGKMKDLVKAGEFGNFIKNYMTASAKKNGEVLNEQLNEQLQTGLVQFMRENGQAFTPKLDLSANGTPQLQGMQGYQNSMSRKQCLYNKATHGAKLDGTFDTAGQYLRALATNQAGRRYRDNDELVNKFNKLVEITNSFSTDAPSDGGFLVPEQFRSDLMMLSLEDGVIRSKATIIPMSNQTLSIPAVDDTTHSGGAVFGGIQTFWVDEATQPTETSAKFAQVKLDVKKLMAYFTCPQELVADAPGFSAFVDHALPKALAFEEDYRFMVGTGVGEPLGFINCAAAIIASAVSGQGANTIIVDNLAAMFARMLPSSLMNSIWIADIGTFPQLALMAVQGSLGNSTPVWMNNGVIGAPPFTIYGRPVYFTEKCPALGTTGDISLVDPSFYLIGDRQAVTASASNDFAFNVDKVAYKVIERVDGRPWIQSALTPRNGGNTLSPFVQLSSTRT